MGQTPAIVAPLLVLEDEDRITNTDRDRSHCQGKDASTRGKGDYNHCIFRRRRLKPWHRSRKPQSG